MIMHTLMGIGVSVPGEPPMVVIPDQPLPAEDLKRLEQQIRDVAKSGTIMVRPPGMTVYQRVDGQWWPLPTREGADLMPLEPIPEPDDGGSRRLMVYRYSAQLLMNLAVAPGCLIRVVQCPMPADAQRRQIAYDAAHDCFAVLVESAEFPAVPEGNHVTPAPDPLFTAFDMDSIVGDLEAALYDVENRRYEPARQTIARLRETVNQMKEPAR